MLSSTAALLLASLLAMPQQPDTTIVLPASAATRLDVQNHGGRITVDTWNRNEVRIAAVKGSRDRIQAERAGAVLRVRSIGEFAPGIVDYHITVPARMDVELNGLHSTISVAGTQGQVRAQTVQGDVTVRGGGGIVSVETVNGNALIENANGEIRAHSVAGEVRLRNVEGSVDAQTVSGQVVLENVRSSNVRASAVNGHVFYDGQLNPNGRYSFSTHSGPVTVGVQEPVNVHLRVAMLSGTFSSSIPALAALQLGRGGRESVTVGNGRAMLEVESFSGNIRVVRRGEIQPPAPRPARGPATPAPRSQPRPAAPR
jgi:hypothetical protein